MEKAALCMEKERQLDADELSAMAVIEEYVADGSEIPHDLEEYIFGSSRGRRSGPDGVSARAIA